MNENDFIETLLPVSKNSDLQSIAKSLPSDPGVYTFLNHQLKPIYIGKAKSLQSRVASYFRDTTNTPKKVTSIIEDTLSLQLTITNSELEALLLEQHLIKKYKPKFNVQFKDDKGYPWIKIDIEKKFPSAKSYLGKKSKNSRFFGPYPNSYAVRDALKIVQKTFKLRNCSESSFKNRERPCMQYEIGRCSAPCTGYIDEETYLNDVNSAELLLSGKSKKLIDEFYSKMDAFSSEKDFERAAIYRDRISSLRDIQRNQSITGFKEERDAIYILTKGSKSKVGVTHVNNGWVTGHQNFTEVNFSAEDEKLEKFIFQHYLTDIFCPKFLIVASNINNKGLIEEALSNFHAKKIKIITRPTKKDQGLMDICKSNTENSFRVNRKESNLEFLFDELRKELDSIHDIETIESFDISHQSGKHAVGGCVVYSRKGKNKQKYRLYNIDDANAGNDLASMSEIIERRYQEMNLNDLPSLIIVDGGKTHLDFVNKTLKRINKLNPIVISISKGIRRKASYDSIHLESGKILPMKAEIKSHLFLQEIRDETHRFCITSQRKQRAKSSLKSSLDDIKGIGPKRKVILIRYFGSLDQIKRASIEDMASVIGIGQKTAELIYASLR